MGLAVEAQARICGFAADRECPISVAEQSVLAGADELRGQHIVIVGAERCGAGPPRLGPLPSGRPSPPPMPPAGAGSAVRPWRKASSAGCLPPAGRAP